MMAALPSRRPKQRMNVREVEKLEYPQHRRFVRGHECLVARTDGINCNGRTDPAHVRAGLPAGEHAGMKQTPHDCFIVPMCRKHHAEQHAIGESAFEHKYGVRLLDTALGLARISPCEAVRNKAKGIQT